MNTPNNTEQNIIPTNGGDTNTELNDNGVDGLTSHPTSPSVLGSIKQFVSPYVLAATLALGGGAMQSCEKDETKIDPIVVTDPDAGLTLEQKIEKYHEAAEAEATKLGWSQGVKSLAAGVIDYYYYKESANGPLLIRLSYHVDVADFIAKIEADAKNRGTYNPKTEGVFQASLESLEGDGKNNVWFVPSSAIYEAQAQGKTKLELAIGEFSAPGGNFNTIGKNEGVVPTKNMQIYSQYGLKLATKIEDRIKDETKRGPVKDIL